MIGAGVSSLQVVRRWNKTSHLECSQRPPILTRRHREIWVQVREEIVRLQHLEDMMIKVIHRCPHLVDEDKGRATRSGGLGSLEEQEKKEEGPTPPQDDMEEHVLGGELCKLI